ncbi:hypothetical protein DFH06DRAFT_1476241 [Mycena polygramma]|nr:hypothetical protein DFH06DRAFT_1476241 [Mycena polygramma]
MPARLPLQFLVPLQAASNVIALEEQASPPTASSSMLRRMTARRRPIHHHPTGGGRDAPSSCFLLLLRLNEPFHVLRQLMQHQPLPHPLHVLHTSAYLPYGFTAKTRAVRLYDRARLPTTNALAAAAALSLSRGKAAITTHPHPAHRTTNKRISFLESLPTSAPCLEVSHPSPLPRDGSANGGLKVKLIPRPSDVRRHCYPARRHLSLDLLGASSDDRMLVSSGLMSSGTSSCSIALHRHGIESYLPPSTSPP